MENDEHLMESSHAGNAIRYGRKRVKSWMVAQLINRYEYTSESHGYYGGPG